MKLILTIALAAITITACNRNKAEPYEDTPCDYILRSETLTIPASIEIPANPAGNTRVATFFAEGVQKYKAKLKAGSTTEYEWVFVAPQAELYDMENKMVGTHSAGPTWQLLTTTDSLYGQQFSPARTAPSPNGSIDWLLLQPKDGKTPTGLFAGVAYIQRIGTWGGKAPATPPVSETETIDVKYTAVYRFTKKNS
jgi:hypothetical protein